MLKFRLHQSSTGCLFFLFSLQQQLDSSLLLSVLHHSFSLNCFEVGGVIIIFISECTDEDKDIHMKYKGRWGKCSQRWELSWSGSYSASLCRLLAKWYGSAEGNVLWCCWSSQVERVCSYEHRSQQWISPEGIVFLMSFFFQSKACLLNLKNIYLYIKKTTSASYYSLEWAMF